MTSLGVALIGTGFMGKCHALAWNAVAATFPDVAAPRLVAVADVDIARAETIAASVGFARAEADWRAVIDDPAVDVVSITAPNQFHKEMALAALAAGKHVWCEKPMATALADAEAMEAAAQASGRVTLLGYNYIQNPAIALIRGILADGTIGALTHLRIEMDEDFMADPAAPFGWKSAASSGYGALDDFAVHPLSLLATLVGLPARVLGTVAKPYPTRPLAEGGERAVETADIASAFLEWEGGLSGLLAVNRTAWGRKGRIALQIFGAEGAILYDQERMNEVQLYEAKGPRDRRGFRTVLMGPEHPPYGAFVPAPGHQLGFNDLKVIEAHALLRRIAGETTLGVDFTAGLAIERTVHAIAASAEAGAWVTVGG
ncbi:Gfo/Idh/MocA family protein [Prosthecomicrobium pneumaticum]|uniref:Putative dehydrogenase n=1 Tax=Prosthecomicrobium pneumaticum TaxID=81895 RepID=A0A7W9FP48_9HYPH|nr:Gfo/Idh/MocA family oxidoreductase [Prosthecomicrobium pneumaticum]MBB5754294.1 putative dehydrogenase [Prosthecomicrobium pneumaticum]